MYNKNVKITFSTFSITISMDPSPLKRDTFWAISIGLTFTTVSRIGLGQQYMQRFLAIPNEADMRK